MKGTIKWYNNRKGYGFIQGDDGINVFIHQTALTMETLIYENDEVEYEIEKSERGLKTANVKILKNN